MKNIIEKLGLDKDTTEVVLIKMKEADLDTIEVLSQCSVKELQSELGLTLGKAKMLNVLLKQENTEEAPKDVQLPSMPSDFNNIKLQVTGNTKVNIQNVLKYLQFGALNALGIEDIGKALFDLIKRREEELDEPNPSDISKLNLLIAKFQNLDSSLALALNTSIGYFSQRHNIYKAVQSNLVPSCIQLISDILAFRLDLASIDSLILGRTFGMQKISNDISLGTVVIAAEEFSIKISKDLRGDNLLIIEESMKMYKELFDTLDNTDLQKYLGAKDKRDLLLKLGVKYTPKDIQMLQELPIIIYQFLHCIENDSFTDSKLLVTYLQKVWQQAKLLDWSKFNAEVKTSNGVTSTVVVNSSKIVVLDEIEEL